MSAADTTTATGQNAVLVVRDAVPADYPAIRDIVLVAYRQYAELIAPEIFSAYLADLLDLETHARHGRLFVVEADQWVCAFGAWYPDASVQGVGLPPGWRALLAAGERLAREAGAPVLAFHTVSFMTGAISLYERLGYRRAPEFDFDWAARHGGSGAAPITAVAFLRHLAPMRASA